MKRRAFIVPALLMTSLFLIMVLGYMSRAPLQRLAAFQTVYQIQARQIALAGMEEARIRIVGDIHLVPSTTTLQRDVKDPNSGAIIGSYLVTLDYSWSHAPWQVVQLESEGFLGPSLAPTARYVLRASIDLDPNNRSGPGANPNFYNLVRWRESVP